jgi:hypothetical protein
LARDNKILSPNDKIYSDLCRVPLGTKAKIGISVFWMRHDLPIASGACIFRKPILLFPDRA